MKTAWTSEGDAAANAGTQQDGHGGQAAAKAPACEAPTLSAAAPADLYRIVAETAHDAIVTIDATSRILSVNSAAERIFGYAAEETLGRPLTMLMPAELRDRHRASFARYLQTSEKGSNWRDLRLTGLHKSGRRVPLEISFGEYLEGDRRIFAGIIRDVTERERAQEALRKAHEEYRSIFDNAVLGIFCSTPDGRLVAANPALARIYGYDSPEELMAALVEVPCQVYVDPARRQELDRGLMERDAVSPFEAEVYRKDRSRIWVSVSARAVRDAEGTVRYHEGMVEDVTERKRAEAALQASEARFRTVVSSVEDIVFLLDREQRLVSLYGRWLDREGIDTAAYLGRTPREMLSPDAAPIHEAANRRALAGESLVYEWSMEVAGSERFFQTSLSPVRDAPGEVVAVVGVARDTTAHRRAEEDLRRQNELLQTIFDHMPCMFNVLGPGAHPLMVNREWTRVLGWTAQELEGQDLLALLYTDPEEQRRTDEFIKAADRSWGEFRQRIKDGRVIDTSWANFRLSDGTLIGIGQDITDSKRAQRALQARARQQAVVARLGHQALAGQGLDALLADAARLVAETLEVERSGVLRLLPGGRELLVAAGVGWDPGLVGSARVPAGVRSLAGYMLSVNTPVVVPDLRVDKRFRALLLKSQGAVSVAATVIGHPEQPFGALVAFAREERAFSEDDLHFLQAMANVLAAAIIRREEEDVRHQLLERLLWAQEEERRRIARELHDEAGQALTSLLVRLRALEDAGSLRQAVSQAASLRRLAARTIDDLGRLARGLSPSVLENLGLHPALERLASEQAAALGLAIALDAGRFGSTRLPPEIEIALYRIAQEALANAGRHASARRLRIVLARENGAVSLVVQDDGKGFDSRAALRAAVRSGRLGLHGMRERALLLGGTLEVASKRGAGTTVSVRIPFGVRPGPGRMRALTRSKKAS